MKSETEILEGVAQQLDMPHPFEDLDVFGGKSEYCLLRTFSFCAKRGPVEVNNLC